MFCVFWGGAYLTIRCCLRCKQRQHGYISEKRVKETGSEVFVYLYEQHRLSQRLRITSPTSGYITGRSTVQFVIQGVSVSYMCHSWFVLWRLIMLLSSQQHNTQLWLAQLGDLLRHITVCDGLGHWWHFCCVDFGTSNNCLVFSTWFSCVRGGGDCKGAVCCFLFAAGTQAFGTRTPLFGKFLIHLKPCGLWGIDMAESLAVVMLDETYLSLGALLVGGVHEDPSVGDGAVDIWDHGAHITSSVGGAAVLQEARTHFKYLHMIVARV